MYAAMNDDHNLFEIEDEEKESNDFSFVGWPDIETLEDADHMFRSLDPTFGCGAFGNEDEFSLFSSQCIDGSDAVPFDFSSVNLSNDDNSMMISNYNKQTKIYNQSGLDSFGYLQSRTPFSQTVIKSESDGVTTPMEENCKFYGYLNNPDCMDGTLDDPTSVSTQVCCSEVKNHGKVNGVAKKILSNLDSSNVPETSCLSFNFDMTSLEESRLCQLQQVMMHQLDIRTQLILRDGLYRLARSADQRHSSNANGRDTNEIEGTKECNGLMDIETDTNSIDRIIAHLLFRRPTDTSANSICDGSSL